jgi:multidrug efflux system membrane fusion protein
MRNGVLVLVALLLAACGGGMPAPPPPGVSVSTVIRKPITEWDEFSGRFEAVESVELRPRVSGYLVAVHFQDGAEVHKGDLLFSIDPREYSASLDSARAALDRAKARMEVARTALARTQTLTDEKAAAIEELEQRQAEFKQADADAKASAAQVRQAELSLSFTRIIAPIDGRISRAEVRPGNLVTAGSTLLSVLVSLDPIYVSFEGNERIYLRYQELAREGIRPSSRQARNPVRVGLAGESGFPHPGEMVFVDNRLDPATGTIRARALLSNAERLFTPGLFARLQLIGGTSKDALLINDRAILTDQDRKYVYVVGDDRRAMRKDITLGREIDGLRIVQSGLQDRDRVVVNGTRKIFAPGQPVDPFVVPMDQPELQPPAAPAMAQRH